MTSLASIPGLDSDPLLLPGVEPLASTGGMLWGMDTRAFHDRFWAARCVQVVRAGASEPIQIGPQLYLLLDAGTLLLFDPTRVLERLRWLKPRSVRLRLVDQQDRAYQERVASDAQGRFIGVRRVYRSHTRAIGRAWLTEDRDLALDWSKAASFDEANRAMKAAHVRGSVLPWRDDGMVADVEAEAPRLLKALLTTWQDPRGAIDTVYGYDAGVWVHESVRVPRGVRFVAPVWVGANANLQPGQVVVGPTALPDAPSNAAGATAGAPPSPVAPPSPIDWREMFAKPPLISDPRSVGRVSRSGKRLFDILFSLAALAATLPIYPFIMLAIYLEDGRPFFFAHKRQTLGGRDFPCLKFRTMVKNAERVKAALVSANVSDGAHFFIKDDPRVTRTGRLLRKLQLDELPQFINVLLGHMSVVGPRPSPDRENQFCPAWREARLSVRPGVTGLWQVRRTRAAGTDFQEWVRYDLEYVQRQSLGLDLRIIFDTICQIAGLSPKEAAPRVKAHPTPPPGDPQ